MNQVVQQAGTKAAFAPRSPKFPVKKALVLLLLSIIFITQIYPLFWLLTYSLKTNEEILSGNFFALPLSPQWQNYKDAYGDGRYLQFLWNSVFVTGITLLAVLVLSCMVAYAITRFRWKYGEVLLLVFLVGIMIPAQATLLPLMVMFKHMHILNTHWSLILPYVAFSMPVAVFILCGFLKSVPPELEESALMDGANVYRTFVSVILPITAPPIMTISILTFISVWNEYILAATFISSQGLKTLPFGVYTFVSQYSANYGDIGAFLVLGALPVLVIYFFLAEKISKEMVAGAIKG